MTQAVRTITAEVVIESICCCTSTELVIGLIIDQICWGVQVTPAGLSQLRQLCAVESTGRLEETLNRYEQYTELIAA